MGKKDKEMRKKDRTLGKKIMKAQKEKDVGRRKIGKDDRKSREDKTATK